MTGNLDDFDARSADELTLRKGDKIELVELDDGFGDGWYLGKHLGHGSTGLFPGGIMVFNHSFESDRWLMWLGYSVYRGGTQHSEPASTSTHHTNNISTVASS